jgi:HlyD family secretion protein
MKKRWYLSIGLVTVMAVLVGCGASSKSDPQTGGAGGQSASRTAALPAGSGQAAGAQTGGRRFATINVQAVTVQSAPLVTDNVTAGTVVPVTQSPVASQVAGVVSKALRKAGDWVKEGALVVQLDDSALILAMRNAQAALENAKINVTMGQQTTTESSPRLTEQLQSAQEALAGAQKNYDSQKALFDLGGISSSQLDTAQSQLQQIQANVEAAKLALDQNQQADTQTTAQLKLAVDQAANQLAIAQLNVQNAAIKAPFSGQIAAVNVTPGMYVSTNTSVFVLVSTDKQINFTVPPVDAPHIKVGDTIQFTVEGKSYPVRVTQNPSAPISGVVPMVAAVPASLPVNYGSVGTITYRLTIATGPQIPIAALQSQANVNYVYTVVNGKTVETPITIVAEAGNTAVVGGVEAGAQVIINPPPGLLSGSTVQVVALPAAQGQGQSAPRAAGGAP